LFLFVSKNFTLDFHHQILSKWKKHNEFLGFANEIIFDIENFKLGWCKVRTLPTASWIGENKMGFVTLSSFLSGMFFLNANINAEFRINVSNMKYMANAYHTLVSLLISKKSNYKCNAGKNMRLSTLCTSTVWKFDKFIKQCEQCK
jgi:hypothetical protein